jgi:hypothetical protein
MKIPTTLPEMMQILDQVEISYIVNAAGAIETNDPNNWFGNDTIWIDESGAIKICKTEDHSWEVSLEDFIWVLE